MSIQNAYNFVAVSANISTSGLPSAEQLAGLRSEGFAAVINLLPENDQYAVAGERDIVERQGLEYVQIEVDFLAPSQADFDAFSSAMQRLHGQRLYVHCAANYRVSVFYGMYAFLRGDWSRANMMRHIHSLFNPDDHPPWAEFIEQTLEQGLS